jgi:fructose-specific phosphotransferase system component IIB
MDFDEKVLNEIEEIKNENRTLLGKKIKNNIEEKEITFNNNSIINTSSKVDLSGMSQGQDMERTKLEEALRKENLEIPKIDEDNIKTIKYFNKYMPEFVKPSNINNSSLHGNISNILNNSSYLKDAFDKSNLSNSFY